MMRLVIAFLVGLALGWMAREPDETEPDTAQGAGDYGRYIH